ncbi:hypothetical protein TNCV_1786961 [Trichonephila clavipes]|nr:hypothetical protein TNCV_1786961 [Trichonephila clavipes]
MHKIPKTPTGLDCPIVLSEKFIAVNDNNVYAAPIMADKDISVFFQSSRKIINANSNDETEMKNGASVQALYEMILQISVSKSVQLE